MPTKCENAVRSNIHILFSFLEGTSIKTNATNLFFFHYSQQHKCGQSDNRCVAGGCNKCFASYPDEPTPSMSWDNLSPEPSPAVTNIQLSQGLEGAAASAQTIPQQENENGAGTGCNSHTPVQGSTYTISCQSAGEG